MLAVDHIDHERHEAILFRSSRPALAAPTPFPARSWAPITCEPSAAAVRGSAPVPAPAPGTQCDRHRHATAPSAGGATCVVWRGPHWGDEPGPPYPDSRTRPAACLLPTDPAPSAKGRADPATALSTVGSCHTVREFDAWSHSEAVELSKTLSMLDRLCIRPIPFSPPWAGPTNRTRTTPLLVAGLILEPTSALLILCPVMLHTLVKKKGGGECYRSKSEVLHGFIKSGPRSRFHP